MALDPVQIIDWINERKIEPIESVNGEGSEINSLKSEIKTLETIYSIKIKSGCNKSTTVSCHQEH